MLTRMTLLCALVLGLIDTQPASAESYVGDIDAAVEQTLRDMQRDRQFERSWVHTAWEKQMVLNSDFVMTWRRIHTHQSWRRRCYVIMHSDNLYELWFYDGPLGLSPEKSLKFEFEWEIEFLRFTGPANIPLYRIEPTTPQHRAWWEEFKGACGLPPYLEGFD